MPWANTPEERRRSDAVYRDPVYLRNRAIVLRQANGRCEECKRRRPLQCDHIINPKAGGGHELTNLQALCKQCNLRKAARESNRQATGQPAPDPAPTPRTAW